MKQFLYRSLLLSGCLSICSIFAAGAQTDPVIYYICPDAASTTLMYTGMKADDSDDYCGSGTKLSIKVIAGEELTSSPTTVTRIDQGDDGHYAQLNINWKPGVAGVLKVEVYYNKNVYKGFPHSGCKWTGDRYMYTYEVHHELRGAGVQYLGDNFAAVPSNTSESEFSPILYVNDLPSSLTATDIRYQNGKGELITEPLRRIVFFYLPIDLTFYTTGIGQFTLSPEIYIEDVTGCGKWYAVSPFVVNVNSSCYKDDFSNVKISPVRANGEVVQAYEDGSFSVDRNQPYTLQVQGVTDFEGHYAWVFDDFGQDVTLSGNTFTPLKQGSYRITATANTTGCPVPNAVEILVDLSNLAHSQVCSITLPDDIPTFFPDLKINALILKHIAATFETERDIIVKPGVMLELGAELRLVDEDSGEPDEDMNFTEETSYDEYGRVLTQTRDYFNDNGLVVQQQVKDLAANVIMASSTLYDAYGRGVITTLPAPVKTISPDKECPEDSQVGSQIGFAYRSDFITSGSDLTDYDYTDFDLTHETTPVPVDASAEGTLGWYYSASNGSSTSSAINEPLVARTQYPYSRTLYKKDGSGEVLGVTRPGDVFKAGSPYMATQSKQPVTATDPYLATYFDMRFREFQLATPSVIAGQFFKTTSSDEAHKISISYTDNAGHSIIDLFLGLETSPITISYSFYDIAGRLLAKVSPNGVKNYRVNPGDGRASNYEEIDKTSYFYDSRGRLFATEEMTAGRASDGISRTEYLYRKDGNVRFSQNEEQRNAIPQRYSYTNYDAVGRAIESGEYALSGSSGIVFGSSEMQDILENTNADGGLADDPDHGTKTFNVRIYYDEPDDSLSGRTQHFVRGAISHVKKEGVVDTWYSYDEKGRIEWLLQDIKGLGLKSLDYRFGPSGNVQDVIYQRSVVDEQFAHHYEYDANGRLFKVYTSREDLVYNQLGELLNPEKLILQATYYYYLHGPLKRIELANNLQGIDYVYTADGMLKGINHADPSKDPGGDGIGSSAFRKDEFGLTLDYYDGDYTGAYQASTLSGLGAEYPEQFSGRTRASRWHSPVDNHRISYYGYKYDARDQFVRSDWGRIQGGSIVPNVLHAYKEEILGYDNNGNIQGLQRNGGENLLTKEDSDLSLDDFSYIYKEGTNLLDHIIEGNDVSRSYEYDDSGRMIHEQHGNDTVHVLYDVTGKVTGVFKDSSHTVPISLFTYDDRGFRLSKTSHDKDGVLQQQTWYVRDPAGKVICTYVDEPALAVGPRPTEMPIYGTNRIGVHLPEDEVSLYELTDHLGTVRTVIGAPVEVEYLATMETELRDVETDAGFVGIEAAIGGPTYTNHTPVGVTVDEESYSIVNPNEVIRINNQPNGVAMPKPVGPGIMLWVHPGDVISAEVFTKYANFDSDKTNILGGIAGFLTTSFGSKAIVDGASIFNVMNNPEFAALPAWSKLDETQPEAFLTYLLFDNNHKLIGFDFDQVSDEAEISMQNPNAPHERLALENINIEKEGYLYIYVSNLSDQNMDVYFDDLYITHTYSDIVSGGDFYPYGLAIKDRQIDRDFYRHKFQGRYAENDEETSWNHFKLREYDPTIGRWFQQDPERQYYSSYVSMGNDPVNGTDPNGGKNVKFDASGKYIGIDHDVWWHNFWFGSRGAIVGANGDFASTFEFADPEHDVADLESGIITHLVFVKESEVVQMLGNAGAFQKMGFIDALKYFKTESTGGGKFDFSYSEIPSLYGASRNPLGRPSSMLFLINGYAHNHMNFGNFLWAAAGSSLGISQDLLHLGAQYNSLINSAQNGYPSQFDAMDDQLSIRLGIDHAFTEQYMNRTYSPSGGLSPNPFKR